MASLSHQLPSHLLRKGFSFTNLVAFRQYQVTETTMREASQDLPVQDPHLPYNGPCWSFRFHREVGISAQSSAPELFSCSPPTHLAGVSVPSRGPIVMEGLPNPILSRSSLNDQQELANLEQDRVKTRPEKTWLGLHALQARSATGREHETGTSPVSAKRFLIQATSPSWLSHMCSKSSDLFVCK